VAFVGFSEITGIQQVFNDRFDCVTGGSGLTGLRLLVTWGFTDWGTWGHTDWGTWGDTEQGTWGLTVQGTWGHRAGDLGTPSLYLSIPHRASICFLQPPWLPPSQGQNDHVFIDSASIN
jgi:hypothetical protein